MSGCSRSIKACNMDARGGTCLRYSPEIRELKFFIRPWEIVESLFCTFLSRHGMVLHGTTWYCTLLHGTERYNMVLLGITRCYIVQHSSAWYNMALHGNAWYCIVQHGTVRYNMVLHGTNWYCMVQNGTTWYCMVYFMVQHGTAC